MQHETNLMAHTPLSKTQLLDYVEQKLNNA